MPQDKSFIDQRRAIMVYPDDVVSVEKYREVLTLLGEAHAQLEGRSVLTRPESVAVDKNLITMLEELIEHNERGLNLNEKLVEENRLLQILCVVLVAALVAAMIYILGMS